MSRFTREWRIYGIRSPERRKGIGADTIILPLWLAFLIVAIPTAIIWHRDRHPPVGHCPICHYNLTGNTSGICPDCGTAIHDRTEGA